MHNFNSVTFCFVWSRSIFIFCLRRWSTDFFPKMDLELKSLRNPVIAHVHDYFYTQKISKFELLSELLRDIWFLTLSSSTTLAADVNSAVAGGNSVGHLQCYCRPERCCCLHAPPQRLVHSQAGDGWRMLVQCEDISLTSGPPRRLKDSAPDGKHTRSLREDEPWFESALQPHARSFYSNENDKQKREKRG